MPDEAWEMLRLWRYFATGMGTGFLPEEGGLMDQAALTIDAFSFMSRVQAQLEKQYGTQAGG